MAGRPCRHPRTSVDVSHQRLRLQGLLCGHSGKGTVGPCLPLYRLRLQPGLVHNLNQVPLECYMYIVAPPRRSRAAGR